MGLAGWGSLLLCLSLGRGEVHHQDPLHLKHGLMPWRCVWLDHGSSLLVGKLALSWHCLLLGGGMLSTGFCLLPSMMSVALLDEEVGFQPWATVHGGTVVVACVARAFSIHSVAAARASWAATLRLLGEGRPNLPSPLDVMRNSSVELLVMAHHGVDALLRVEPMKVAPSCPSWGRGAGCRSSQ
jgi:hypothetical protein